MSDAYEVARAEAMRDVTEDELRSQIDRFTADKEKLRKALEGLHNDVEKVRAAIEATARNASEAKQDELARLLNRYSANLQWPLKSSRQAIADTE